MAITPTQQYYLVMIQPGNPYGPGLSECVVQSVSPDIVTPKYAVKQNLICQEGAWIALDDKGGTVNGALITEDTIVCTIS